LRRRKGDRDAPLWAAPGGVGTDADHAGLPLPGAQAVQAQDRGKGSQAQRCPALRRERLLLASRGQAAEDQGPAGRRLIRRRRQPAAGRRGARRHPVCLRPRARGGGHGGVARPPARLSRGTSRGAQQSGMSSKSRREAASKPETTFGRSNARLRRERGLSRRWSSANSARQAPGKRTMRRSSRFRERRGRPLCCTGVITTSSMSRSISPRSKPNSRVGY
jgi:hypothetical protein